MNEKKQNNNCELIKWKVDSASANLNFVYFFLACDISDVLFVDQPCHGHLGIQLFDTEQEEA